MASRKLKKSIRGLSRREFVATSAAAAGALFATSATPAESATLTTSGKSLDIAEWSFFWTGVERVEIGKGNPVVSGKQMYIEYQIPAKVRHPYPIVLVHGGGGQGLDWMGTPDGRRGWATMLLEEGYKVYVVDRPGHGRAPFHPELHGNWPRSSQTLESISGLFTPQRAKNAQGPQAEIAKLHNQWPGTGAVDAPELAQLVASQGGSYGNGPGTGQDPYHQIWRMNAAQMLDKIGPAIIMTHSAGGPFGYHAAEVRPKLVKGVVVVEGAGTPFAQGSRWGLSAIPVEYDPPVSDPAEIKTKRVEPSPEDAKAGVQPFLIQEEPARKLKNWQGIPMALYTSEASFASPGTPGALAYLKQAGVPAEEIRLKDLGIHGNGHLMMGEKNNRECLQPILSWLKKNVEKGHFININFGSKPTALKLADQGYFWVGLERKKIELPPFPNAKGKGPAEPQSANILVGQMFVQYLKPAQKKHSVSIVLVHGGGGQGTHYMGLGDGNAGWAHYWVQSGYDTYIVDRPGHGRAPYHPDALGPITGALTYSTITGDFKRAAQDPNRRWIGTGDVGDPWIDQFQAGQNSTPTDNVMAHKLWASRGAELLDKIGPAVIMVHSAGGPFSWIVANERPKLVKAIVNVEGASPLFTAQTPWGITTVPLAFDPPVNDATEIKTKDVPAENGAQGYKLQADPPRKLKNLQGIPSIYVVAERSGRNGVPVVAFLKQAGVDAEAFNLKDKGVLGNGHFMMLETNRKQVFDLLKGWVETKVKA